MDIICSIPRNDNSVPFDSTEFDAGYLARVSGESQCLGATHARRVGWADADAGLSHPKTGTEPGVPVLADLDRNAARWRHFRMA